MLCTTTDTIAGQKIVKHLGMVRGSTVRARHIGRDILAIIKNLVGGEISDYTKLMAEAREQALDRMVEEARELGADAVVRVYFASSEIMGAASEILVYGTAVKLETESSSGSESRAK